jgi:hypothetical protein
MRCKIREHIAGIRSTLQSMSRPRGYKAVIESKRLTPSIQLHEGDMRVGAEVNRLATMLKIDSNHALAESLLPVALLNLGEIAMTNINEMFYEGLSVPADLMRELSETLANEYGYAEGADWSFVDKGGYNAIYFENKAAHTDACDLLENLMGCGFLAEDVDDKILQYASNWMAKRNSQIGGDAAPGKDMGKEAQELAAGLRDVLSGTPVAHPNDMAGGPKFADPAAELAFKLSLFLEPTAGLKNDALFNYLSIIVDKLQSGAALTQTEKLIANNLVSQVSVGESVVEGDLLEGDDAVAAYAQKWTAQRFGQSGTDVVNKSEEERDACRRQLQN